jgi:DNA-binding NarL/FixJ family response regulator
VTAASFMPGADSAKRPRVLLADDHAAKRAGCRAKLMFLNVHEGSDCVRTALRAGGIAYVIKGCLASDLITAIHEAPRRTQLQFANNFLGRKPIKSKWLSETKQQKRYGSKKANTAKLSICSRYRGN